MQFWYYSEQKKEQQTTTIPKNKIKIITILISKDDKSSKREWSMKTIKIWENIWNEINK